jgi:hypothetical protein
MTNSLILYRIIFGMHGEKNAVKLDIICILQQISKKNSDLNQLLLGGILGAA